MTLWDNLTCGRQFDHDVVVSLLQKMSLWSPIELLPKGLNSIYGVDVTFSAGQLRRLYIVRNLLQDYSMMVLDEPFSDLDKENQERLLRLLNELSIDHGFIIISHVLPDITTQYQVIKVGNHYE